MRDVMLEMWEKELGPTVHVNSPSQDGLALPSILNVSFAGVSAEKLLMNLDMAGIAVSSGSACTSGSLQPSHVLMVMRLPEERVTSAIRFSFSGQNTLEEITEAAQVVAQAVKRLRH